MEDNKNDVEFGAETNEGTSELEELEADKEFDVAEAPHPQNSFERAKSVEGAAAYSTAKDKYEDNISSAHTFLVFGIGGLVFVALNAAGIIGFLSQPFQQIVGAALFVIFLAIAVVSYKNAARFKAEIETEGETREACLAFLSEHFTKDALAALDDPAAAPEANDLVKTARMADALLSEFPKVSQGLADDLVEEYYSSL